MTTLDHDVLWPRDLAHRYRVYGRVGNELTVLCACPEPGGIGVALVTLHEDQKQQGRRLADLGYIGVLDVMPNGAAAPVGDWIVYPFARSEQ